MHLFILYKVSAAVSVTGPKHTILRFAVKFFPPDHAQLLEELTRWEAQDVGDRVNGTNLL